MYVADETETDEADDDDQQAQQQQAAPGARIANQLSNDPQSSASKMSAKQPLERQGSAAGGIGGSISGGNSSQSPSLSVCALAVHDEWQVRPLLEY